MTCTAPPPGPVFLHALLVTKAKTTRQLTSQSETAKSGVGPGGEGGGVGRGGGGMLEGCGS